MMKGGANAARKVRASAERRRGGKLVVLFRLVAKNRAIATFDGVCGGLGQIEQLGEFRPVGAAGEEGVDQRRGDDAEPLQALLFLEGLVMSGLLGREVGVALLESREEHGVFFTQAGFFGLFSAWRAAFSSRRALALALTGAYFWSLQYSASLRNCWALFSPDELWRCNYGLRRFWPQPAPREADQYTTDQRLQVGRRRRFGVARSNNSDCSAGDVLRSICRGFVSFRAITNHPRHQFSSGSCRGPPISMVACIVGQSRRMIGFGNCVLIAAHPILLTSGRLPSPRFF